MSDDDPGEAFDDMIATIEALRTELSTITAGQDPRFYLAAEVVNLIESRKEARAERDAMLPVVEAAKPLLAFWDAWNDSATLDPGDELISDGVRLTGIVSLLERDDAFFVDNAHDAAEASAAIVRRYFDDALSTPPPTEPQS